MKGLFIDIWHEPMGWKRARRNGNRYFVDPKETEYRECIKDAAECAMLKYGWKKPEKGTPIQVHLVFQFQIPKSYSKRKREGVQGFGKYTHKPDADNLAKAVLDALSGLVFDDDAEVSVLSVEKRYAPDGNAPSIICRIGLI